MPAKTDQAYSIPRPAHLEVPVETVATMTRPERQARVLDLMAESRHIYEAAIDALIVTPGKDYLGTAVLFSGGNDSTTLAHLARPYVDLAVHANTTVGVEQTREFVRKVCADWGWWLEERHAPTAYRDLVLESGFPGPGQHFRMYQRLKERVILAVRADLVSNPRRERLVYLAGRRRDESTRRDSIPLWEREGSLVWVSPLAYWTKLDLNTYRLMAGDVPRNIVSDQIHMSGECLCGSFAKRDELEQIAQWFPGTAAELRALEAEVHEFCTEHHGGHIPHERTRWGWGAYRSRRPAPSRATGALCTSCIVE
jgi:3'-phosphoadenosine 5'-phosphosulfate sulfotransferase (PAPS reductase)/FAD synthetase